MLSSSISFFGSVGGFVIFMSFNLKEEREDNIEKARGVRQHYCKKKAATVGQNGRLSALGNFFSF